jgi:hypothetical protein
MPQTKARYHYCNIAVTGKGLGAMSNNDGKFLIKIPASCIDDTLAFFMHGLYAVFYSCGRSQRFAARCSPCRKKIFNLKTIDVVHFQPSVLLQKISIMWGKNYENEYNLLTTFISRDCARGQWFYWCFRGSASRPQGSVFELCPRRYGEVPEG